MTTNTARLLYDELSSKLMPNKLKPELGAVTELIKYGEDKIEMSFNWDTKIVISFRPQTIGIKIKFGKSENASDISKSYPLNQDNLLEILLGLLVNKCNK